VQRLYADVQHVLAALDSHTELQSQAWFNIEDQMIAALAHAGHLEQANVHRLRILDFGGAPSADSYGALVAAIKNTTDDSSLAEELFEESMRLGVQPNVFLFNTVISKVAKSRKADYALQLFHQMMSMGLRPTEVTYASVIGACCRVADGESAEFLFVSTIRLNLLRDSRLMVMFSQGEMLLLPRYKARVPVYNNMIQFYVSQKDRIRALHYYEMLLGAGLKPTEHTYKVI
jgi:pentatricopeptide repeat protein